jgi:hypothetical protein
LPKLFSFDVHGFANWRKFTDRVAGGLKIANPNNRHRKQKNDADEGYRQYCSKIGSAHLGSWIVRTELNPRRRSYGPLITAFSRGFVALPHRFCNVLFVIRVTKVSLSLRKPPF